MRELTMTFGRSREAVAVVEWSATGSEPTWQNRSIRFEDVPRSSWLVDLSAFGISQLVKRLFFSRRGISRMQPWCDACRSAAARWTLVKVSAADCDCTAGCWHQTSKWQRTSGKKRNLTTDKWLYHCTRGFGLEHMEWNRFQSFQKAFSEVWNLALY